MVTIIIPSYNCRKYLAMSVESVINQTYTNWKLLIIDDCSTDGTGELSEELAKKDNRITVLHNEQNRGVSYSRNRGIKEADTKWIAFLDSDDLWEKEKLEKQFMLIDSIPEAKLIYSGSAFIKENGERINYVLRVPNRIDRKELLKQNLISCSSVLVLRDLLLKYPMPEKGTMHEDYTVWLRILENEKYAYGIDEPLLIYRRYYNSKSGNKFKSAIMNWNAYKYIGLNPFSATYYMCWYMFRGLKKYSKLR